MKKIILILLFLFVSIILKADNNKRSIIDSVYIVPHACWDCITEPPISCIDKDSVFITNGYLLTNRQDVKKLLKIFDSLKISHNKHVDTRFKIYFYNSDTIVRTAFISRYYSLSRGNIYKTSSELVHFIDSIIHNSNKQQLKITQNVCENIIIRGKKDLQMTLNRIENYMLINNKQHDNIAIKVFCFIDTNGNTINVRLFCNNKINKIIPDKLLNEIKDVFLKKIKWNYNHERQAFDIQMLSLQI